MQVTGRIKARRTAYDVQFKLVCNAKFHPQNQQMGNYFKPSGKFKLSCEDNLPSPSVIVLPTSYQCEHQLLAPQSWEMVVGVGWQHSSAVASFGEKTMMQR